MVQVFPLLGFPGLSVVKNPPAEERDTGDAVSIPGVGRSPRGGTGNPPQYSCLENPMNRAAWRATGHGVEESDTAERARAAGWFLLPEVVILCIPSSVWWLALGPHFSDRSKTSLFFFFFSLFSFLLAVMTEQQLLSSLRARQETGSPPP